MTQTDPETGNPLFPEIGDDWDVEVDDPQPESPDEMPIYGGERRGIATHLVPGRYTGVATSPSGFEALVHVVVTEDQRSLVSDLDDPRGEAHPSNVPPGLYPGAEDEADDLADWQPAAVYEPLPPRPEPVATGRRFELPEPGAAVYDPLKAAEAEDPAPGPDHDGWLSRHGVCTSDPPEPDEDRQLG